MSCIRSRISFSHQDNHCFDPLQMFGLIAWTPCYWEKGSMKMSGIYFEELLVVKQLPLQEKLIYFLNGSGNKVYLNIFSTIYFFLIFTREIMSRKPNINFVQPLNSVTAADYRSQIQKEFLPHCLMGTCKHFLPHCAFGRSYDHTNSTLTTVKENILIIFWATRNTLHFNVLLLWEGY